MGEPQREDLHARVEGTLLASLRDESWAVRKAAAVGLVRLGESAVPPLVEALGHEGWEARQAAAVGLGMLGLALEDQSSQQTLGRQSPGQQSVGWQPPGSQMLAQQSVPPLSRLVRDKEPRVRLAAVRALGQIGGCLEDAEARAQIVKALSAAIRDGDGQVREAAANALGRTGGSRAVESLLTALEDPDHRLQAAVTKALDRLARGQGIDTGPIRS
jgi:HEAT repeat protein